MPDARHNGNGQYQVLPPKGKKEVGYTRVSNVAKLLEDGNSLINWRVRQTMKGLVRRPDLQNMVAAHPDDKRTLDRVAADALEAADASAGANSGTALHSLLHQWQEGRDVNLLPEMDIAKDLEAVKRWFVENGCEIVPGWVEHMVVHHKHKVAGTFDFLIRMPDGSVRIGDYKTTKEQSLHYAYGAWCIQLACYGNGDPYVQDPAPGQDRYPDWPEGFDIHRGLIISIPVGSQNVQAYDLDLDVGWEAAKHALWTRQWRKRKDLVSTWPDPTIGQLEASLDAAGIDPDFDAELEGPVVTEPNRPSVVPLIPDEVIAPPVVDLLKPVAPDFMPDKTLEAVAAADKATKAKLAEIGRTPSVLAEAAGMAPKKKPTLDLIPAGPPPAPTQHGLIPERSILSPEFTDGLAAIKQVFPGAVEVAPPPPPSDEEIRKAKIDEALHQQNRQQIAGRIRYIKANYPAEFQSLAFDWPVVDGVTVPGLAGDHKHTAVELRAIELVVERIEDTLKLPFPDEAPPLPEAVAAPLPYETPAHVVAGRTEADDFDRRQNTDNGGPVDQADIDALAARLRALPPEALLAFKEIGEEAAKVGWKMNVSGTRALRQYAIATMLIMAAENGIDEAKMIKEIIKEAFPFASAHEADIVGGLSTEDALEMANRFNGLKPGGDWSLMIHAVTGAAYLVPMPF